MTGELAHIFYKLEKDADERAEERDRKRLLIEKEEERKRLTLEAELEERRREQERRHEMQMQSMMLGFLQQMTYSNPNRSLYGSSSHQLPFYPPTSNYMPLHDPDDDDVNN